MRRLALVAIAFALLTGQSIAQSVPDLSFWNGPYAGFVSGAAMGSSTANTVVGCINGAYLCDQGMSGGYQANGALIGATASGTASGNGLAAGILSGYDWRTGNFVAGFSGDLSLMPLQLTNGGSADSINVGLEPSVFTVSATAAIDWLATLRGRMGVVVAPTVLLYATAGLALTNLRVSNSYVDNFHPNFDLTSFGTESSSTSALKAGYVFGVGSELALGSGWGLTAEYLYVNFGPVTTSGGTVLETVNVPNPITSTADLSAQIARVGLVHQF